MKLVPVWAAPADALLAYIARNPADAGAPGNDAGAVWDRFRADPAYGETMAALITAQQGLCAYCEQALVWTTKEAEAAAGLGRVPGTVGNRVELDSQIEHVAAKSHGVGRTLDPGNMIACCAGGSASHLADFAPERHETERRKGPKDSCGQRKGDRDADVDPRVLPLSPPLVRFDVDGRMLANPAGCAAVGLSEETVTNVINKTLNLNCARLKNARRARYSEAQETFDLLKWAAATGNIDAAVVFAGPVAAMLSPTNGHLRAFWSVWRQVFEPLSTHWVESHRDALNLPPLAAA